MTTLFRKVQSKELIQEALAAYRVGAYRASIATTWVAVCVDIIEKITELSSEGDKKAKKKEDEITILNPKEKNKLVNYENSLLDIACDDLGIITFDEKNHLSRIKEDRDICMHPSFHKQEEYPQPLAENVRNHLVVACKYLLTQEPMRGKALTDFIMKRIKEDSFPDDFDGVDKLLTSQRFLGRANDSLLKSLCRCILKMLFKNISEDDPKFQEFLGCRYIYSLQVIRKINRSLFDSVMKEKLNKLLEKSEDATFKRIFLLMKLDPDIISLLSDSVTGRVKTLIQSFTAEDLVDCGVYGVGFVKNLLIEKVQSFKDEWGGVSEDMLRMLKSIAQPALLPFAMDLFWGSGGFRSAEANGRVLFHYKEFFSGKDLKCLLEGVYSQQAQNINNNQILGANGMPSILLQLYQQTKYLNSPAWIDFCKNIPESEKKNFFKLRNEVSKD